MLDIHAHLPVLIGGLAAAAAGLGYFVFSKKSPLRREEERQRQYEKAREQEAQQIPAPKRLDEALSKSSNSFTEKIEALFGGKKELDPQVLDQVEELLITSDMGAKTADRLLSAAREQLSRGELRDANALKKVFGEEIRLIFSAAEKPKAKDRSANENGSPQEAHHPRVILIVGVNGVGKTTTIGKLAHYFSDQKQKVLVVAGDTFRAAAENQLDVWAQRSGAEIYRSDKTRDPAAVCFEGVERARAQNADVVILDTAGRLHNKENLMEELKKTKRVLGKALPGAPHETWLVIDANTGQNAVFQAREFHEALGLTGLIVTKLDGTARGGVVVAIQAELGIPVKFIGLGEKPGDLRPFSAEDYARALLLQ